MRQRTDDDDDDDDYNDDDDDEDVRLLAEYAWWFKHGEGDVAVS